MPRNVVPQKKRTMVSVRLSERQRIALIKEAERMEIPFAEVIRRIIDDAIKMAEEFKRNGN